MVVSKINSDIIYGESQGIDPEDKKHTSSVYSLIIEEKHKIAILLGKPKYTHTKKGVIYFPIYAISNGTKVRGKIGVFEISTSQLSGVYKDGEINISKLDTPLLFSKINDSYLEKLKSYPTDYIGKTHLGKRELAEKIATLEKSIKDSEQENISDSDSDDDQFTLKSNASNASNKSNKSNASKEKNDSLESIFEINEKMEIPELLEEETEKIAKELKKQYKESSRNNWLEKHMKNNNYSIVDNDCYADCLFEIVRDAFSTIGKKTTISKLREILAHELNDEIYMEHRSRYLHFEGEIKECKLEMGELKKSLVSHKKRVESATQKSEELVSLVDEAKKMKSKKSHLEQRCIDAEKWQRECSGFMKTIDSLENMREFIKTSSFWADEWAIQTIEKKCNVKFIIFDEDAFVDGASQSIMYCGNLTKKIEETMGSFRPDYYILVSRNNVGKSKDSCGGGGGNKYKLVKYKGRSIFKFREVPFDVKILLLQKCVEKNGGIYYLIQDFRNMKTEFGIDADEGKPRDFEDEIGHGDLYDSANIFVFCSTGEKKEKAGYGNGERIDEKHLVDYIALSKIEEWRRKLDDKYDDIVLTIDSHKWASVEHYVQGSKYKKGFPDIYIKFSLDSGSELSKDIKLLKNEKIKAKPDDDYVLGRDEEERMKALNAKFVEQEDMKHLLKSTHNALLLHKERKSKPAEPDLLLMTIRKKIMKSSE